MQLVLFVPLIFQSPLKALNRETLFRLIFFCCIIFSFNRSRHIYFKIDFIVLFIFWLRMSKHLEGGKKRLNWSKQFPFLGLAYRIVRLWCLVLS
jgi:hypothetical protein